MVDTSYRRIQTRAGRQGYSRSSPEKPMITCLGFLRALWHGILTYRRMSPIDKYLVA